ncbi:MAG TPA: Xaa-Pro peptidase family protein [Candidatus Deferrimicrobium sp.]|nr:Xaa-Pro peptidase family protein [Candidatus Deferrimicrobium sp.]
MSATIGPARFAERLARAQAAVAHSGSAAMLVGVGPELEWLVGYPAVGHERLNLLVVPPAGPLTFVGPRLEAAAAEQAPGLAAGSVRLMTWEESDDPYLLVPPLLPDPDAGPEAVARPEAAARPEAVAGRILVSDGLRAAFLLGLQGVLGRARWGLASALLAPLRRSKDADELILMREAAEAADRVIEAIAAGPVVGRTEAEVAREVRERLVDEGHDSAEFAIVASGPNSASPHHGPGERVIRGGEPLLLDIGGRRAGYCSDTTRTFWVAAEDGAAPPDGFVEIHRLTEEAQAAARATVRPGISFAALDAEARDRISAGGHGRHFIHRLGHGIGLEVHEEPYVIGGNDDLARVGDTFSIEPGIYLEGRYGVRIEDVVVVVPDGGQSLNTTERSLRIIAGS